MPNRLVQTSVGEIKIETQDGNTFSVSGRIHGLPCEYRGDDGARGFREVFLKLKEEQKRHENMNITLDEIVEEVTRANVLKWEE